MQIVYSSHYNITCLGAERLHPFDSRKYGRAWNLLRAEFGSKLSQHLLPVDRPVSNEELLLVHSQEYLDQLRSSAAIAAVLEIPFFRLFPTWLLRWRVLRPMR